MEFCNLGVNVSLVSEVLSIFSERIIPLTD